MKPHTKKLVAPIIVTTLLILYELIFILICVFLPMIPLWGKLVGIMIPLALVGVGIGVLVERIREIRSGEEDDLSKY